MDEWIGGWMDGRGRDRWGEERVQKGRSEWMGGGRVERKKRSGEMEGKGGKGVKWKKDKKKENGDRWK